MAKRGKRPSPVLCVLSDGWQERISDGPVSKGKLLKFRWSIIAQKFSWALAYDQEGSPAAIGKKFPSCFEHMACALASEADLDPVDALERIAAALGEKTGKKLTLSKPKNLKGSDLWIHMAREIDTFYKTNFAITEHAPVRGRVFGGVEDEDEDD